MIGGDPLPQVLFEPGVITAVTDAAAVDGRPMVTVSWRGITLDVAYIAPAVPYSTADVGSPVLLLVQGTQVLLVGVVHGTPPDF